MCRSLKIIHGISTYSSIRADIHPIRFTGRIAVQMFPTKKTPYFDNNRSPYWTHFEPSLINTILVDTDLCRFTWFIEMIGLGAPLMKWYLDLLVNYFCSECLRSSMVFRPCSAFVSQLLFHRCLPQFVSQFRFRLQFVSR